LGEISKNTSENEYFFILENQTHGSKLVALEKLVNSYEKKWRPFSRSISRTPRQGIFGGLSGSMPVSHQRISMVSLGVWGRRGGQVIHIVTNAAHADV